MRPDGSNLGVMGQLVPPFIVELYTEGSESAELHDSLVVDPTDIILSKPRYGAFHGTDLESILRSSGIDTIIVTGIATNICCETTAREAAQRDFRVFFLTDETATKEIGGVPAEDLAASDLRESRGLRPAADRRRNDRKDPPCRAGDKPATAVWQRHTHASLRPRPRLKLRRWGSGQRQSYWCKPATGPAGPRCLLRMPGALHSKRRESCSATIGGLDDHPRVATALGTRARLWAGSAAVGRDVDACVPIRQPDRRIEHFCFRSQALAD